jgi:hypothetical protein
MPRSAPYQSYELPMDSFTIGTGCGTPPSEVFWAGRILRVEQANPSTASPAKG